MRELFLDGKSIALDKEGYLENLSDWTPDVANKMATQENIPLSPAHWEIIQLIRQFYTRFEHSPNMRILVKYIQKELGENKGNSIYVMQLFPGSSAKVIAKIAGLPRPTHCL